mgnify:CR=1 FL=1
MKHSLAALLAALAAALPVRAETVACPDPARAVQVATCPSEDELRYTFNGFCSDDRRLYARDSDTCASYENYRKAKNIALWESADGAFHAYLSCDLPAGALQGLKPRSIAVSRQGKLTRIACSYAEGIVFTHRSKAQCRVIGRGDCAADAAHCQAVCD